MSITIAGEIGSGKSAVRREIGRLTGWQQFSTGEVFREIAGRLGMSVLELNRYAETHQEIDDEVDDHLRRLAKQDAPVVVDSRMAWFFLPRSFKAFLVVDPATAAKRVFSAERSDESYANHEHAEQEGRQRQQVEADRYNSIYSVDSGNWRNYDLVVDTTHASAERVAALIVERSEAEASGRPACWLSPRRLIPTRDPMDDEARRDTGTDASGRVDVAVHRGHCLIAGGHAHVSAALRKGQEFLECRLLAFEGEEVSPGRSVGELAESEVNLDRLREWESTHDFEFDSFPSWLSHARSLSAQP